MCSGSPEAKQDHQAQKGSNDDHSLTPRLALCDKITRSSTMDSTTTSAIRL